MLQMWKKGSQKYCKKRIKCVCQNSFTLPHLLVSNLLLLHHQCRPNTLVNQKVEVPLLYWFIISRAAQTMFAQYVIFKPLICMLWFIRSTHMCCDIDFCQQIYVLQRHWKQPVSSVLVTKDDPLVFKNKQIQMKILNVLIGHISTSDFTKSLSK